MLHVVAYETRALLNHHVPHSWQHDSIVQPELIEIIFLQLIKTREKKQMRHTKPCAFEGSNKWISQVQSRKQFRIEITVAQNSISMLLVDQVSYTWAVWIWYRITLNTRDPTMKMNKIFFISKLDQTNQPSSSIDCMSYGHVLKIHRKEKWCR